MVRLAPRPRDPGLEPTRPAPPLAPATWALAGGRPKPPDPERALRAVLRTTGKRAGPSLSAELGGKVSFEGARARSFARLVAVLQGWFGEGEA
jgi:hypothetical protein